MERIDVQLDYLNLANRVFEGTRYQSSDDDIQNLATNIKMLEERGLSKLNRRLLESGRKFWDTVSEHNFAVKLLSYHSKETPISYEPEEGLQRPPDFKIVIGEITYWVQVKRLSNIERENRQNKIVDKIKNAAKEIEIGMFFGCYFSDQFSEDDIADITNFISECAKQSIEGKEYYFPNDEHPKARVEFWFPNKSAIPSLTLGMYGDMDIVEVTGLAKNQIKQSLINAASAFDWDIDQNTLNLVVIDADKKNDIDLCDAVFGTEFEIHSGGRFSWSRGSDGFFNEPGFSNKVAGVITLKSKEWRPISQYLSMLFVNENFKDRINDLDNLLLFDKVIHFNMRPPMGKGDFDIT